MAKNIYLGVPNDSREVGMLWVASAHQSFAPLFKYHEAVDGVNSETVGWFVFCIKPKAHY